MFKLHDPGETLDYTMDWTDWMAAGDAISTSAWSIAPSDGTTLSGDTFEPVEHTALVVVDGLLRGQSYQLTNTIVTEDGRTGERSFTLRCDER